MLRVQPCALPWMLVMLLDGYVESDQRLFQEVFRHQAVAVPSVGRSCVLEVWGGL